MSDYFLALAQKYTAMGKTEESIKAFRDAISMKPNDAKLYLDLGSAYARIGQYKYARDSIKRAVRLKPDYFSARYNLAVVCLKLKDRHSAMNEYKVLKIKAPQIAGKLQRMF